MAWLALIIGYVRRSIPGAVIVSRRVAGVDIHTLGDGMMSMWNVRRSIGWRQPRSVRCQPWKTLARIGWWRKPVI
jgi:glycerol-3-phosphate acyltransferase PlsY